MENKTLTNFVQQVKTCDPHTPWNIHLQMFGDNKVSVHYAPFEHINTHAKVVICGITPGKTQAIESLKIAQNGLVQGLDISKIQEDAKQSASFKGFRKNLSAMLDHIGLNKKLEIDSCSELFGDKTDLVHYTSALRYPVITGGGKNYNGTPKASAHPYLKDMLDTYLAEEVEILGSNCLWIPLGKSASEALEYLVFTGKLQSKQLLSGLPHPSGANAERVAYFLGNKAKEKLSIKVNPEIIDSAKSSLMNKIQAL